MATVMISWTMTMIGEKGETRAMPCHIALNTEMPNNLTSQRQISSSLCRYSKVQSIVMEAVVQRDRSTLETHQHKIITKTTDNRICREECGIHSVKQLKVEVIERIINREQS